MRSIIAYILLLQVVGISLNSPEFGTSNRAYIQSPLEQGMSAVDYLDDLGLEMRSFDDDDSQDEETTPLTSSFVLYHITWATLVPIPSFTYSCFDPPADIAAIDVDTAIGTPPPRHRSATVSRLFHLEDSCHILSGVSWSACV